MPGEDVNRHGKLQYAKGSVMPTSVWQIAMVPREGEGSVAQCSKCPAKIQFNGWFMCIWDRQLTKSSLCSENLFPFEKLLVKGGVNHKKVRFFNCPLEIERKNTLVSVKKKIFEEWKFAFLIAYALWMTSPASIFPHHSNLFQFGMVTLWIQS